MRRLLVRGLGVEGKTLQVRETGADRHSVLEHVVVKAEADRGEQGWVRARCWAGVFRVAGRAGEGVGGQVEFGMGLEGAGT